MDFPFSSRTSLHCAGLITSLHFPPTISPHHSHTFPTSLAHFPHITRTLHFAKHRHLASVMQSKRGSPALTDSHTQHSCCDPSYSLLDWIASTFIQKQSFGLPSNQTMVRDAPSPRTKPTQKTWEGRNVRWTCSKIGCPGILPDYRQKHGHKVPEPV